MQTFNDFATWAGGQAKAARLLGIHKNRAHRLAHGKPMRADEALRIELVSGGLFRKEVLMFSHLAASPSVLGTRPSH
jgi:DNA-binding transcriptional regulator YdaS (Cro superfamily)